MYCPTILLLVKIELCPKMMRRIRIPFIISEVSRGIDEIPPHLRTLSVSLFSFVYVLVLLLLVREITRFDIFDIVRNSLGHNGIEVGITA